MRISQIACLAALSLLVPHVALANGRFPAANQLVFDSVRPESLVLRTTFGVLRSDDGAAHTSLICDQIIGSASVVDPGVAILKDGVIVVASPDGLLSSRDNGCTFAAVGGEAAGQKFVDVSEDKGNSLRAVAVTATLIPNGGGELIRLFETTDGALSWHVVGNAIDPKRLVTTLDVAPSRPQRLYMSGVTVAADQKLRGYVAVSDDSGVSWTDYPAEFPNTQQLYIAAIDPINPDIVYVRTYYADSGPSSLLVSTDGAKSFASVYTVDASLWGFALSPDGAKVAVGTYLGTAVAQRPFPRDAGPVDASTPWTFEKRAPEPVNCLGWSKDGTLYACGLGIPKGCGQGTGEFLFARTSDDAATWTTVIPALASIGEPSASCGPDTPSARVCTPDWPRQKGILECAYTAGDGGMGTSDGAGANGAPDAGPTGQTVPFSDSCLCTTTGARRGSSAALLSAAALLVAGVRRALRKRRGHSER